MSLRVVVDDSFVDQRMCLDLHTYVWQSFIQFVWPIFVRALRLLTLILKVKPNFYLVNHVEEWFPFGLVVELNDISNSELFSNELISTACIEFDV